MISYAKFHLGKKADNISDLFPKANPFHFSPSGKNLTFNGLLIKSLNLHYEYF